MSGTHQEEACFHDGWAAATAVGDIRVRDCFEAITAQENSFIMRLIDRKIGGIEGRKVLDIGSGLGESAVYFALKGADVTAADISPEMVGRCMETARHHGVEGRVKGVVSPAEGLDLPGEEFDVIYMANLLHHVSDFAPLLQGLKEHLRPGGLFVSWDPIAYNPLINVYRRMAKDVRTRNERPLRRRDLDAIGRIFPGMEHREFWLLTLALFLKYYLIDEKDPNKCRYWKEVLTETESGIGWWFRPLLKVDEIVLKLPGIRWLAWNTVVWAQK